MKPALLVLFACAAVWAAPAPPEIIVNDQTMECSHFNRGDECFRCEIPEGWTSRGYGIIECPEGYAAVAAPLDCRAFRNSMCCSMGHSGAPGECDEMAVNHFTRQCMFLNRTAPLGWETMPVGMEQGGWQCPSGYSWPDEESGQGGACPLIAGLLIVLCIFTHQEN